MDISYAHVQMKLKDEKTTFHKVEIPYSLSEVQGDFYSTVAQILNLVRRETGISLLNVTHSRVLFTVGPNQ
ncbi:hypothetical protein [Pseudomonas phage vB_Pae_TUMS_P11]|nr:hypothetical protein [Pseudomonas phage vB_Pae_TUMS_P11]